MARSKAWRSRWAGVAAAMILLTAPARAGCSFWDVVSALSSCSGAVGEEGTDPAADLACGAAASECLGDVACDVLGWDCPCTPPPPQFANCSAQNVECSGCNLNCPSWCPGINSAGNFTSVGQFVSGQALPSGNYTSPDGTYTQVTSSTGTLVLEQGSSEGAGSACNGSLYCFCPSPMKIVWAYNDSGPISGANNATYVLACVCPSGMHPGATMRNGISACLCNGSNQLVNFSGSAPPPLGGWCPPSLGPPACPNGQERLAGVGSCVTPCANPNEGMTFDGSCCDPAKMTSCGKCCPPGTTPDPTTGSCLPPPPQPK